MSVIDFNNNQHVNRNYEVNRDRQPKKKKSEIKKLKIYPICLAIMFGSTIMVYHAIPSKDTISIKHLLPERSPISKYSRAEQELKYLVGTALGDGHVLDASNSILYDVPQEERSTKWHEYCQKIGLSETEELALKGQYSEVFHEKTR